MIYINSYREGIQYDELKRLLGFNISQFKSFIEELYSQGIIEDKVNVVLSNNSLQWLEENGLLDLHICDLLQEKKSIEISENKMKFTDIYIPRKFKL
jgi:hypothetical protein